MLIQPESTVFGGEEKEGKGNKNDEERDFAEEREKEAE